jgi:hypothetical protein
VNGLPDGGRRVRRRLGADGVLVGGQHEHGSQLWHDDLETAGAYLEEDDSAARSREIEHLDEID